MKKQLFFVAAAFVTMAAFTSCSDWPDSCVDLRGFRLESW